LGVFLLRVPEIQMLLSVVRKRLLLEDSQ
jgi:hypothetical protein